MKRTQVVPFVLMATAACAVPAGAMTLAADAVGAVGGTSAGSGYVLGQTGGLTLAGRATSAGLVETAGFWGWGDLTVSSVPSEPDLTEVPRETRLQNSYPNPFARATRIGFQIAGEAGGATRARLEVFDLTGRRVATLVDRALAPGAYQAAWDGRGEDQQPVANGVYFARLTAGDYSKTIRIVASR